MQGLGGLLRLAPVTIETLLSRVTATLSGFGLFSGVSFGLGHAVLLRIVIRLIVDTKETLSHDGSISKRDVKGAIQSSDSGLTPL